MPRKKVVPVPVEEEESVEIGIPDKLEALRKIFLKRKVLVSHSENSGVGDQTGICQAIYRGGDHGEKLYLRLVGGQILDSFPRILARTQFRVVLVLLLTPVAGR